MNRQVEIGSPVVVVVRARDTFDIRAHRHARPRGHFRESAVVVVAIQFARMWPASGHGFVADEQVQPAVAIEIKPHRRLPVITTLHGTDITLVGADRSYLPITRYALEQSDGVTAISNYLKQATIETFQFDRIEVIPNFVCPSEYKPRIDCDLRQSLAPDDVPIMVHVSNFRPVKRPIDCVEILARVLTKTDARLVMVGDGSERTSAIHRARCLGVFDKCVFVGKQPRIVDYLCAADVLLLPSEQESFGLAALEAMAVQVPVIASRVGGLPEVVDDGETGFLSAVGDVDKMAADAVKLLIDPKLRREMGKRARESAVARYRTDIVIPKYIDFYNRVLARTE